MRLPTAADRRGELMEAQQQQDRRDLTFLTPALFDFFFFFPRVGISVSLFFLQLLVLQEVA